MDDSSHVWKSPAFSIELPEEAVLLGRRPGGIVRITPQMTSRLYGNLHPRIIELDPDHPIQQEVQPRATGDRGCNGVTGTPNPQDVSSAGCCFHQRDDLRFTGRVMKAIRAPPPCPPDIQAVSQLPNPAVPGQSQETPGAAASCRRWDERG